MRLIDADKLIVDIQKKLAIRDIEFLTEQEETIVKMIIDAPTECDCKGGCNTVTMNQIDPIKVKTAVKDGQLRAFIQRGNILLQDIGGGIEGDTVCIGKIPHGEWSEFLQCSVCGFSDNAFGLGQIRKCNFCPNCGAKMEYGD